MPQVTKYSKWSRKQLIQHLIELQSQIDALRRTNDAHEHRPPPEEIANEVEIDYARKPTGMPRAFEDATEREEAELIRRRLATISEFSPDAIAATTLDGTITDWNPAAEAMFGYMAEEAIGSPFSIIVPPDRLGEFQESFKATAKEDRQDHFHRVRQRKDGSLIDVFVSVSPIKDTLGNTVGFSVVGRDITELKQREEALRLSEERYALAVAGTNDGIWDWDIRSNKVYFSPRWKNILGYREDELDPDFSTLVDLLHSDDRDRTMAAVRAHLDEREPYDLEFRMRHESGEYIWVQAKGQAVWDDDGNPLRMAGSISDIADRKQAEGLLRENEERYRKQYTLAPVMMHSIDLDGRLLSVTDHWLRILGYERDEVIGRRATDLLTEKDRQRAFDEVLPELFGTGSATDVPYQFVTKSGEIIDVMLSAIMQRDADGQSKCSQSVMIDVTQQIRAEHQLRQAQKMEAVGQLTGGVAHDFNNFLAVILGNAELLKDRVADDVELVEKIERAALRGADLTRRLLAFSRRQPLQTNITNVDAQVADMINLLKRTLGETIAIAMVRAPDPWHVKIDLAQLESAILNLAINARDAMPNGGTLAIETANVILDGFDVALHDGCLPGDYVRLAMTDSGVGMSHNVVEHAIEPFFTTKDVGEGTGLGLSMVYGFVRQSGGFVEIESEPNQGCAVRLYLPRAIERADAVKANDTSPMPQRSLGGTVLVVEDDPDVREFVVRLLAGLGCATAEANDGAAALARLEQCPDIDLLFTDVVLPNGMSGPDIAREARRLRPDLKIVFTSGYPDKEIGDLAWDDERPQIVFKPYTRAELVEALSNAMKPLSRADASG
jgi:PAS domain S-box-containing protein